MTYELTPVHMNEESDSLTPLLTLKKIQNYMSFILNSG